MTAVPVATIEILNDLLDAELGSVFRFMGDGSPYLSRATAEIRRPLAEMVIASDRRASDLFNLIESLGGAAIPRGLQPEEQYLAYLSLKFLIPKLVAAKELAIKRYNDALAGINSVPDQKNEVTRTLDAQRDELIKELQQLEHATLSSSSAGS